MSVYRPCLSPRVLHWQQLQCESSLVVSLGTERRLSISERRAAARWHSPIKGRQASGALPLPLAWINYFQGPFQPPYWRMQLKHKQGKAQGVIKALASIMWRGPNWFITYQPFYPSKGIFEDVCRLLWVWRPQISMRGTTICCIND